MGYRIHTRQRRYSAPGSHFKHSGCDQAQAFFDTAGGSEILEEAGTFSAQALLLLYPYPKEEGGPVKEAALTALSTSNNIQLRGGIDISV